MTENYNILLAKIDRFIRKYYKNQIIKGLILGLAVLGIFYLSVFLLEYFNHFSVKVRTGLFYGSLAISLVLFIRFILLPVFGFLKIGKVISIKQASKIIANHFPNVQDKLLNTIELQESEEAKNKYSQDLVLASIDKRIAELKPIPFQLAIDLRRNIPLLKYLAAVVILFVIVLGFSPEVISEGSERIINHRTFYERPAPFTFKLESDSLLVEKGNDFTIKVNVEGEYAPSEVYISYSSTKFIMKKISAVQYEYQFKNLNNSLQFSFLGDDLESDKYMLRVIPTPMIMDILVDIEVPDYTGENDLLLENVGDITIPEGSTVSWKFSTIDSDSLNCRFSDSVNIKISNTDRNTYEASRRFSKSTSYSISVFNNYLSKEDVISYYVNVVPDLYPGIQIMAKPDSINPFIIHFLGNISDDYGFGGLKFKYTVDEVIDSMVNLPFDGNLLAQEFYYGFDFSTLKASDKKKVEYYFEVWDNDGVNGSKSTRSNLFSYQIPSKSEIDSLSDNASKEMEDMLKESMEIAKKLQKDVKKLKEKTMQSELSSWEQKQAIEDILKQENQLEKLLDEIAKQNESKEELDNSMQEMNEEIQKKQEQLQDLMENVMDEELQKLLEELRQLQDEMDPKELENLTEELDMSYEDLNEQLDRNLEMLKKYDLQNKIEDKVDELEKLAEVQNELSEQAKDKSLSKEELSEKQAKQKKEFENIKEDYEDVLKENQELEEPMNLDDFKQEMEDIQENFEQNQEMLEKGKNSKASKGQKKNSKSLEKLSKSMQKMMQQQMQEQASENMDDIRQIIENLVTFSFDVEQLMINLGELNKNDPQIIDKREQQNKLAGDFSIISDSIYALAKRVPQLSSLVNKELLRVSKGLNRIEEFFDDDYAKSLSPITREQQFIMTAANNLALLLNEALESMQQEMSMQSSGQQNCQKDGQGKPSFSQMQKMQQSLKEQVKGMLDQMKGQKGEKGSKGKAGMNKKMAQMLAQQEVFRKMMQELGQGSKVGSETQKILSEINKMMKDNEKDLVNKNITPNLLERQKLILSRLLEAEKSENQREIEKKRKSKENKDVLLSNPEKYFEYNDRKHNFSELFEKNNVALKNYYNNKYKKYLKKINEDR